MLETSVKFHILYERIPSLALALINLIYSWVVVWIDAEDIWTVNKRISELNISETAILSLLKYFNLRKILHAGFHSP